MKVILHNLKYEAGKLYFNYKENNNFYGDKYKTDKTQIKINHDKNQPQFIYSLNCSYFKT